jgi:hypothetical protein
LKRAFVAGGLVRAIWIFPVTNTRSSNKVPNPLDSLRKALYLLCRRNKAMDIETLQKFRIYLQAVGKDANRQVSVRVDERDYARAHGAYTATMDIDRVIYPLTDLLLLIANEEDIDRVKVDLDAGRPTSITVEGLRSQLVLAGFIPNYT